MQLSNVIIDFEVAIHTAVKIFVSHGIKKFKICLFPLNTTIKILFLARIIEPQCLEPSVGDCYTPDFTEFLPTDIRVQKFCDYLVENYIGEDDLFPPPRLN